MSTRGGYRGGAVQVSIAWLGEWTHAVLCAAGATPQAAAATAACLTDTNRRGLDSHGVVLLHYYLPLLRAGAISGSAVPEVVVDLPAAAVVDAHDALGHYAAALAMGICCDKAEASGCGFVAVRNSSHFGAASYYSELAARRGCVGIALSNSDASMGPLGALGPVLGTNPLAIAAPPAPGLPLPSLDIATSVVAQGRIVLAERAGARIPLDWAIGPDGRPTDDPAAALAGSVLPVGVHKGFALAFMIDLITGCLAGSGISPEIPNDLIDPEPQRVGHAFFAVHVGSVAERDAYTESLTRLTRAVHSARRAEGTPPFMTPGEREAGTAAERSAAIPVDAPSAARLTQLGEEYGVPFRPGGASEEPVAGP
jgi:LDH2 family malate/lactate/ureidoglycolate dehydrogenase